MDLTLNILNIFQCFIIRIFSEISFLFQKGFGTDANVAVFHRFHKNAFTIMNENK
ncbi:hypothetical protein Hanom_Chr12g01127151 [Helianthus anomalus]